MNKKLIRNIEKQKNLRKKKRRNWNRTSVISRGTRRNRKFRGHQGISKSKISLDEFLFIVRKNKEEENRERQELKRKDTNESEENLWKK